MEKYTVYFYISHNNFFCCSQIGKIPKYASLVLYRFNKPLSRAYWDLGQAYITNNPDKVKAVITKNEELYVR